MNRIKDLAPNLNLVITENGLATELANIDAELNDFKRLGFIKHHVKEIKNLKTEGKPIDGYFVWSWLDNFVWAEGFRPRFGLVKVNYTTQ